MNSKKPVPYNELKRTSSEIVDNVGGKINDRTIESCHGIDSQSRTIVKFRHKRDCQQSMKVKKDLSKLNLTDIDLSNTKIYINQSLCPYYKLIWSKSKQLHAANQVQSYFISNGTVEVKVEENSRSL